MERFGDYELIERLARGGMAEVFRARRTGAEGFSKEIAIKRILPQFCEDAEFIRMFINEIPMKHGGTQGDAMTPWIRVKLLI